TRGNLDDAKTAATKGHSSVKFLDRMTDLSHGHFLTAFSKLDDASFELKEAALNADRAKTLFLIEARAGIFRP
ncbi:MAG: hypothetical protein ACXABY_17870, partial [Candidatus Thorarchaeota archaeon]